MCLALNALLAQTTPTLPEQQDSLSELAEIKSTLVVLRGHLKELEDIIAAMNKIDEDWALALSQATEADKTRMARIYDKDQEDYQCEVMTTRALEARRGLLELIRKFTSREVMLATICQQGHRATVNVVKAEPKSEARAMSSFPVRETMYMCTENVVCNPDNPELKMTATIIWDSCCGLSYITERAAKILGLPIQGKEKVEVFRAFSSTPLLHEYDVSPVSILANNGTGYTYNTSLRHKERITTSIPVAELDLDHPLLKARILPFNTPRKEPDILLGARDYDSLKVTPQEKLPSGFSIYQTLIGPLIYGEGQIPKSDNMGQLANVTISEREPSVMYVGSKQDQTLQEMVEQHFSLQNAGLQDVDMGNKDEQLLEEFTESLVQGPDG
uniref:DUF1758 domain-containing protein n=1 Tax=Meloidogyne javanica TaxID=6303 RepID=A0A915LP63_MELJA